MYCVFSSDGDYSAFQIKEEKGTRTENGEFAPRLALNRVDPWFSVQGFAHCRRYKYVCRENNGAGNTAGFAPFQLCSSAGGTRVLNLASQQMVGPLLEVEFDFVAYEMPYLVVARGDMLVVHNVTPGTLTSSKTKNAAMLTNPLIKKYFPAPITCIDAKENRVVVGLQNGDVFYLNIETVTFTKIKLHIDSPSAPSVPISSVHFNSFKTNQGRIMYKTRILVGTQNGGLYYIDVARNKTLKKFNPVSEKPIVSCDFSPISDSLLVTVSTNSLSLYDYNQTNKKLSSLITIHSNKWFGPQESPAPIAAVKFVDEKHLLIAFHGIKFIVITLANLELDPVAVLALNNFRDSRLYDVQLVKSDFFEKTALSIECEKENEQRIKFYKLDLATEEGFDRDSSGLISDPHTPRDETSASQSYSPSPKTPLPRPKPESSNMLKQVLHANSLKRTSVSPQAAVKFQSTPVPVKSRDFPGSIINEVDPISTSPIARRPPMGLPPGPKTNQNLQPRKETPQKHGILKNNGGDREQKACSGCSELAKRVDQLESQNSEMLKLLRDIHTGQQDLMLGQKMHEQKLTEEMKFVRYEYETTLKDRLLLTMGKVDMCDQKIQEHHDTMCKALWDHHETLRQYHNNEPYIKELESKLKDYSVMYGFGGHDSLRNSTHFLSASLANSTRNVSAQNNESSNETSSSSRTEK